MRRDNTGLTLSGGRYLCAILEVCDEGGARLTDLARKLDVTKPSAFRAVEALMNLGLVFRDDNRRIHLSPKGLTCAKSLWTQVQIAEVLYGAVSQLNSEELSPTQDSSTKKTAC